MKGALHWWQRTEQERYRTYHSQQQRQQSCWKNALQPEAHQGEQGCAWLSHRKGGISVAPSPKTLEFAPPLPSAPPPSHLDAGEFPPEQHAEGREAGDHQDAGEAPLDDSGVVPMKGSVSSGGPQPPVSAVPPPSRLSSARSPASRGRGFRPRAQPPHLGSSLFQT
jgi:hypothetical protein